MLPLEIKDDIIQIKNLFNNYIYMKKTKEELLVIKTNIIHIISRLDVYKNEAMVKLAIKYDKNMKNKTQTLNSKDLIDTSEFYEKCIDVKFKLKKFLNKVIKRIDTLEIGRIGFSKKEKNDFYIQIFNYIENNEINLLEELLNENIIDVNYHPQLDDFDDDDDSYVQINVPLIIVACEYNNLSIVKMLHNSNANLNVNTDYEDEYDITPLLAAIISSTENDVELITYLLDNGASPNFIAGLSTLPLNAIIYIPDLYEKMIVKYGADVNLVYPCDSPLTFACETLSFYAIKILLANGADVNFRSNDNWSALHYLASAFKPENDINDIKIILDLFIAKNFNFNFQSALDSSTLLHHLASLDLDISIIKYLLDKNIVYDANLQDASGNTVLHYLIDNFQNKNEAIIKQIIELFNKYNFDFNLKNNLGNTVLHNAIKLQVSSAIINYLLNNNININIVNNDNKTILQLAKAGKNQEIFHIINNYQISNFGNIDNPSTSTSPQKRKCNFEQDDNSKKCCSKNK